MTWRTLWGSIQIILTTITLVGILIAPIGIMHIKTLWISAVAWIGWGILVVFITITIGLTPYRGQKEITKDVERDRKQYEEWMWEARHDRDKLEQEITQLKQKH